MNITKKTGQAAVLSALFPWVGIGLFNIDSKPYPLVFSILFIAACYRNIKLPPNTGLVSGFVFIGLLLALACSDSPISFLSLRSIYNYLSFFVFLIFFYNYLIRFAFPYRLIIFSGALWILAGIIETQTPEIINLLSPIRTSASRGITSLSPEPTFFAIYLFFSSWLLLIHKNYSLRDQSVIFWLQILSIMLLAQSTMGALYLILALIFAMLGTLLSLKIRKSAFYILISAIVFISTSALLAYPYFQGSRLITVIGRVAETTDFYMIFHHDASMNARLEHVVFALHGTVLNGLLPGGFDTFDHSRPYLLKFYNGFFWYSGASLKIMSWLGDWVYSLGLFGILALAILFYTAAKPTIWGITEVTFLYILLLSAIPLAFPLIPMLIASFIFYKYNPRT
ncbi:hypothetical protein [Salicola sp. Rm-C-2C1-2]|uniref:hypothetical protein n=1 Tax=Salicola sp. Rm-C-2C1-2 TaxID=3141321 RepID=UPI0032E439B6